MSGTPRPLKLCSFYNQKVGCSRGNCKFVHICSQFIQGGCSFGERCTREHGISYSTHMTLHNLGLDSHDNESCLENLRKFLILNNRGDTVRSSTGRLQSANARAHGPGAAGTRNVEPTGTADLMQLFGALLGGGIVGNKSNAGARVRTRSEGSGTSLPTASVFNDVPVEICTYDLGAGTCQFGDKCRNAHSRLPYLWQIRCSKEWRNTSESLNEELEKEFVSLKCQCRIARQEYDFIQMLVKPSTPLRRLSTPNASKVDRLYATVWTWFYQTDDGQWNKFGVQSHLDSSCATGIASRDIEKSFQCYIKDPTKDTVDYTMGRFSYCLTFSRMEQENTSTRKIRKVIRRPDQFIDPDSLIEIAENWKSKKSTASAGAGELSIKYPDFWDWSGCDNKEYALVKVASKSAEYKEILGLVHKTLVSPRVRNIMRVQSTERWEEYQRKRVKIEKCNGKPCAEMSLYHGTNDRNKCDAICQLGFDMRLAGSSTGTAYGEGTYFHRDASYSQNYCGSSGKMILTKVLVGEYARGDSGMRRPPPKNPVNPLIDLYDSTVDSASNPSIFVVYDNHQAYPAYVITFK